MSEQLVVKLPKEFIATKYPGYFWNYEESKLYSLKINGILKPLKMNKWFMRRTGGKMSKIMGRNYRVSVNGFNRLLFVKDLIKLKPSSHTIPTHKTIKEK